MEKEKTKRFELVKGKKLYAVDSSGSAPDGERLKRRADREYKAVKEIDFTILRRSLISQSS